MNICSVEGCDRDVLNQPRQLCGKHYKRWLRHRDIEVHYHEKTSDGALINLAAWKKYRNYNVPSDLFVTNAWKRWLDEKEILHGS